VRLGRSSLAAAARFRPLRRIGLDISGAMANI
jgi:hypothetical protein